MSGGLKPHCYLAPCCNGVEHGCSCLVRNANAWREAAGKLRGVLTDTEATEEERARVLEETAGDGVFDLVGFDGAENLDMPRGAVSPKRQEEPT